MAEATDGAMVRLLSLEWSKQEVYFRLLCLYCPDRYSSHLLLLKTPFVTGYTAKYIATVTTGEQSCPYKLSLARKY